MKAKLLIDLRDSYNEVYHSKGDTVDIIQRTLRTESDTTTVGHIKQYPYKCGWFYITKKHFKKL
jgi:hypothetical protein